ncbi:MAG: YggT family protein [Brevinema sp.]
MLIESVYFIFNFLNFAVQMYNLIFFIWIIMSWFPIDRSFVVFQFIDMLINPVYNALLKIFPPLRIGILDLSPFYMFIFLTVIDYALIILRQLVFTLIQML